MIFDPHINHRHSIRLRGYDYSQPGMYYVTICTQDKKHLFGEVVEGEMKLNGYAEIIAACWRWLQKSRLDVQLDEWVLMPNHLHGILRIVERRGGSRTAPTKPLGRLIGAFKTVSAIRINEIRNTPGAPVWQRNYYEHIIRNEDELNKIRKYIRTNPLRWATDPEL
jgi:putative transposase